MKRVSTLVCFLAIGCLQAFGAKKDMGHMTDQQFVDFAAQTDMVEANLGQLAEQVAAAQPVKDYGQLLASDHTADYQQLSSVARKANLHLPSGIDSEHNKMFIAPFHKLKGTAFDHRYASEMAEGHAKAIEVYKKEAADGQDPALKAYAQQSLSILERHLADSKNLGKNPGE